MWIMSNVVPIKETKTKKKKKKKKKQLKFPPKGQAEEVSQNYMASLFS